MPELQLEQRLILAVSSLSEGEVISFGDLAERAGSPKAPRAAGRFLSRTKLDVPWWRVVYSNGKLPPCNIADQSRRLLAEGVTLLASRVIQSPRGRFQHTNK